MFNFFKKPLPANSNSTRLTLAIKKMHCTSCAVNIDLSLEDLKGVVSAKTNYAKAITEVDFDPNLISPDKIVKAISSLGYPATIL